ncbi:transposase-like protein, IS1239 [Streptococcus pneumoniae]|nr:transposase-like protein, IS1239 [Streptococcus pneumoniae]
MVEIVRGGSPRPIKDYLTSEVDGINWIKIGDTEKGEKYINNVKEKIKKSGLNKTRFVKKGTFLLTNSMSFGRPYILNVDGAIHDGWLAISNYENSLNKDYLFYILSSNVVYSQFLSLISGAVVKNLNSDKVASILIPLPPLSEQQRKQVKVGISTIYYWFHNGHLGLTKADMLYPRKRKGVKKQASPNFKPAGKSIEERPDVINLRLENGHYEIDTVLLTKIKNYCLLVLTDRRSRHQIIRLIPNKTAESVNQALTLLLGEHRILSITADNGSEFKRLSEVFPEEHIYYAHAYSSWERGSNENHNRLIRRWLPKGTKKTTPKEVAFIENWINNYPKKCLDYKSPSEFLLGG